MSKGASAIGRCRRFLVLLAAAGYTQPAMADRSLAAFLAEHWRDPPSAATATSSSWGALERTLRPADCGGCHPAQYADWTGSRHAKAMSAGLQVQLLGDEAGLDSCNRCHAPLAEQRPTVNNRALGAQFRPELRAEGLFCASCHVRLAKVLGPPRRSSASPATAVAPAEALPHGGFTPSEAFSDSRFCANCHQFAPGVGVIAGVPLENTYAEWQDTIFARQGISCQGCHMPDRRHLWRGIHDPEMTASGLDVELTRTAGREARFTVTSVRVGHKFPTYVTPRVTLVIEGVDRDGRTVLRSETVLQRRLDVYLQEQTYDTRLEPGAKASVELSWWPWHSVSEVVAFVYVEPDEFYDRFFKVYQPADAALQPLLEQARQETGSSAYRIHERRLIVDER